MDAETQAAIERLATRLEWVARDVQERVRWLSEHHEREWKDAAAWRTQWAAELDALIVEVGLLRVAMEQHVSDTNETQHERIYRTVNDLTAAFADVLFDLLPPEKQPLKVRFTTSLGNLLSEVLGGATVMAAGVVVSLDKRISALEERQVGSGD